MHKARKLLCLSLSQIGSVNMAGRVSLMSRCCNEMRTHEHTDTQTDRDGQIDIQMTRYTHTYKLQ